MPARMGSHKLTEVLVIKYNLKVHVHLRLNLSNCCRRELVLFSLVCYRPTKILRDVLDHLTRLYQLKGDEIISIGLIE
jgi:hypothetical protein